MAELAVRKQQLVAFYQTHEPSKVSAVDTLLTQYKYEDVVASLMKKYGTLPEGWGAGSSAAAVAVKAPPSKKDALIAFYQKYEPSKIAVVDTLLSPQYKFEDVITSLQTKYGALPEGWGEAAAAAPVAAAPVKKVSAPPAPPTVYAAATPAQLLQELQAFYQKHEASKVSSAETLLAQYKLEDVTISLMQKYGAIPPLWGERASCLVQGKSKSETIDAGGKHEVKIPVTKVGTAVKWFYGMNMDDDTIDIGFEAYFIGTDFGNFNQKTPITAYSRLKIPNWPGGLSGSTQVSEKGNVVLIFDNSYSWVKCKVISFKCEKVEPA